MFFRKSGCAGAVGMNRERGPVIGGTPSGTRICTALRPHSDEVSELARPSR